jgi:aminoglycoside phosphotransferase (APT) family kinase protein
LHILRLLLPLIAEVEIARGPCVWTIAAVPMSIDDSQFERLAQRIHPGSRLLRSWQLAGGVSAQVTAFETERPDGLASKMVVRRYGDADLQHNPRVAADEFRLLQIVRSAGLAAPTPYYLDQQGEIFSRPCIVIEYIEGVPGLSISAFAPSDLEDTLFQMAAYLSGVHRIDGSNVGLSFLPRQDEIITAKLRERPARVDDSLEEGRIRRSLEALWPLPTRNKPALLHGDFWPGNMLWRDGRLVAVVDWEDAKLGDPLADLANSRLEILWAFGMEAMRSFTGHYMSITNIDYTDLPCWDLCAALRPAFKIADWAGSAAKEKAMRLAHRMFVTQALERIN